MAFVSGPRQVGKTTVCQRGADFYLNWDTLEDQKTILDGQDNLARKCGLDRASGHIPTVVLDELRKYSRWKNYLKGFFDKWGEQIRINVTGSSRLDIYRRGADSLMGRYFLYRMHPFSVGEIARTELPKELIRPPVNIPDADGDALWRHGGFPEPFLKRDSSFTTRWQAMRFQQLTKEDLREVTAVQELGVMEVMAHLLGERSGEQLTYSSLAQEVRVAQDTAKRWVNLLERMHYGFLVLPWFKNVANSLRKEPKWFLRDWSDINDPGRRAETFVACHFLKAVEGWTDLGLGRFELRYLRTKQQKEVDFVVVKEGAPWFLVEVKYSDDSLPKSLYDFHEKLKTEHAFQVVIDKAYVEADCFSYHRPITVPARTFLSQLL
jgi:uncharacterized protein